MSDGHRVVLTHVQGLQQFTEMQNTTTKRQLSVNGLTNLISLSRRGYKSRRKPQRKEQTKEGIIISGKVQ